MSKMAIPGMVVKKDPNGNKNTRKDTSHGTFRCVRHPNRKRRKNGTT